MVRSCPSNIPVTWCQFCFSYSFFYYDKTSWLKSNLGERGLFHLKISKSITQKVKTAITQSRNWRQEVEQKLWRMLLPDLLLIAFSACSLEHSVLPAQRGTTESELGPLTTNHQSTKCCRSLQPTSQSAGDIFQLRFPLFPSDSSFMSSWHKARQHSCSLVFCWFVCLVGWCLFCFCNRASLYSSG